MKISPRAVLRQFLLTDDEEKRSAVTRIAELPKTIREQQHRSPSLGITGCTDVARKRDRGRTKRRMQIAVGVAFKSMFSRIMRPLRTLVGLRDGTVCVLAEMASIRRYGIRNSPGGRCLWSRGTCGMAFRA